MDDWAKIRQLFSTGQHSKRQISRLVGVSRGTVERALETDRIPKYQRPTTGSSFDAYAAQVRVLLAATPRMPASTLSERVGWLGSASVFRDKVAAIRPEYVPPDPADRLVHEPGKQVQCDLWFPHEPLPLGHAQEGMPPVLVMMSTFSGFFQGLTLPSRSTSDLLGGMWSLLQAAQAVPPRLLWDNETGIGRGKLTERTAAFAGTLGTEIKLLKARDPESKGMVERAQPVLLVLIHAGPALRISAGLQRADERLDAVGQRTSFPVEAGATDRFNRAGPHGHAAAVAGGSGRSLSKHRWE